MTAVEICPICDIAGCRHVRESKAKMTHPTDEELDALVKRAMVIDPLLEVDFDTQRDVEQDPYGAREAIETALYLIRDQAAAITAMRAQLAEAKAEKEKLGRELNLARYGQPDFSWQVHKEALSEANARADRAEAALAAQIEADAGIAEAERKLWDRGYSTSSAGFEVCRSMANVRDAIRAQPHDRTALDRVLAEARAQSLREAANVVGCASNTFPDDVAYCVEDLAQDILDLINPEGK